MINFGLLITSIIAFGVIIVANFFLIVYYSSVEDKNTAWFPKIVTLIGLTMTQTNILLLPMDVGNATTNGGLPMQQIWIAFYIIIALFGLLIIPFTIFYYEAEDPDKTSKHQVISAVKYEIVTFIIVVVLSIILYLPLGYAEVPVTVLTHNWSDLQLARFTNSSEVVNSTNAVCEVFQNCTAACLTCTENPDQTVVYPVTYLLFIFTCLAFVGLFLLTLFGGIGFAALPVDLLNGFRLRPKRIPFRIYAQEKIKIGMRADRLLDKGKKLQQKFNLSGGRPKSRRDKAKYNEFRTDVFLLEEDYSRLKKAYGEEGKGPLILGIIWGWCQLPLSIIAIIITLCWLLQLFLYMMTFPPLNPFLNTFFIALQNTWGLFGTLAYGIFAFYMLWCVMKGTFKFGVQIPFIIKIHPMKPNETMMSSFLFNTELLLLSSVAVVQFCTNAFSLYAGTTGIDVIFGVGVQNLRGLKYFFRYYQWAILALAILTAAYLLITVKRKKKAMKYKELRV